MKPSTSARRLLSSLQVTTPRMGVASTTVYTTRKMYRHLGIYRELHALGLIAILQESDVTASNERHARTFITYKLIRK